MSEITATVRKLCDASRNAFANPFEAILWPDELDEDAWFTSPELISIYGTETYDNLSERERKTLSFFEAVNFYSLNIHGEKPLVHGLAERMYRKDTLDISPYLHHFLDEENKHMIYFGGFCTRYAGKVYADKKVSFPREDAPGEEDFLFFAKVLIFEEIVDVYNLRMSIDNRLHPLARQINGLHHHDESRHLVFGRKLVAELFAQASKDWSAETLDGVRQYLSSYLSATWREYYNPEVYKDAALPDPYGLQKEACANQYQREHRHKVSSGVIEYLKCHQMIDEEPEL